LLTPFSGDWNIEAGPLKELVDDTFQEAGLIREDIDTGAVIITGEAGARDNRTKDCRAVFRRRQDDSFGANRRADAGNDYGAHGSGAVQHSREQGLMLLNIDVGGGTTKLA